MKIDSKNITTNNQKKEIDLAPFIKNGRTFVPFRLLGEELKATISFEKDPISKNVTKVFYELQNTKIELLIGQSIAIINGVTVNIDSPAFIKNGRTVVPLRFVSENLGCSVFWDTKEKAITVKYAP